MFGKLSATFTFSLLSAFLAIILFAYLYSSLEWAGYEAWLWACSIAAFVMYGLDKLRASQKKGRVPNVVLHSLALTGGFMGAWLGMFGFWHKIRQWSFWIILALSALLHGAILNNLF